MTAIRRRGLALALVTAGACMALTGTARAATIDVSTTADPAGAGSCPGAPCSLRQAVAAAQAGDTIQLAGTSGSPDVYALTQGGQIVVNKSLTIQGEGVGSSTVDGSSNHVAGHSNDRILKVTAGTLNIDRVTFTGGSDENDEGIEDCNPCLTLKANGGGALFNDKASVVLDEVAFDGNGPTSGQPVGGAIGNAGT